MVAVVTFVLFFRQTKQALGVRCCLGMMQESRPLQIVPFDLDKDHLREKGLWISEAKRVRTGKYFQ